MLQIDDVHKRYGSHWAVRGISLEVEPGEIFGFLGPNGAGKTTTIKMIVGLTLPTRGSVRIGGHDVVSDPTRSKQLLGYIPDRPHTYEKLRGREFLEFVAGIHGVEGPVLEERSQRLLEMFRLDHAADDLIENYSHGMRQKIILCAALVHDPALLVVDEPMVGLDPRGARQIRQLLLDLAAEGKTLFISTHSLHFAADICTRIGIVREGELISVGSMEELRARSRRGESNLEEIFLELTEEEADEIPR